MCKGVRCSVFGDKALYVCVGGSGGSGGKEEEFYSGNGNKAG